VLARRVLAARARISALKQFAQDTSIHRTGSTEGDDPRDRAAQHVMLALLEHPQSMSF